MRNNMVSDTLSRYRLYSRYACARGTIDSLNANAHILVVCQNHVPQSVDQVIFPSAN